MVRGRKGGADEADGEGWGNLVGHNKEGRGGEIKKRKRRGGKARGKGARNVRVGALRL